MLHVGMILGYERFWGKELLHVGMILGERAVTCRHDSGGYKDSGGKSCYM